MIIKLEDFVRENAYVLYKGNLYGDVNHCFALELALNSENKSLNLDLEYKDVRKAEKIVEEELSNKTISSWNWYSVDDKNYFVCNFEDDFFEYKDLKVIQDFIKEGNMGLGYHTKGCDFFLHDDKYLK